MLPHSTSTTFLHFEIVLALLISSRGNLSSGSFKPNVRDPHYRSGEDRSSRASDLDLVHRLSQAAHCAAQGKVGSGFDVSAAVFGSQRYVRFSPSALLALGEKFPAVEVVRRVFEAPWDEERRDFALPPGLVLVRLVYRFPFRVCLFQLFFHVSLANGA